MHLTRIFFAPGSKVVQRALRDSHAAHRLVMSAFPDGAGDEPRARLGVLYRIDVDEEGGTVACLVQSSVLPSMFTGELLDARAGADAWSSTPLEAFLHRTVVNGRELRFRLRANPTRAILTKSLPDGRKQNGKRVPVRGDEARAAWLERSFGQNGMGLVAVLTRPEPVLRGTREGARVTHEGCSFEGVLRVDDAERAIRAIGAGIGRGKAYGFGLLSVAAAG